MINQNNFMIFSIANFQKSNKKISQWDFISRSGSKYKYTQFGVYRLSNHFGNISSCTWLINNETYNGKCQILGFCSWNDFKFKTEIIVLDDNFKTLKKLPIDSLNQNQLKAMIFNCKIRSNYQNENFLKL